MEKYRKKKIDLYMIFIDLKKTHDRIPREVILWVLGGQKRGRSKYPTSILI